MEQPCGIPARLHPERASLLYPQQCNIRYSFSFFCMQDVLSVSNMNFVFLSQRLITCQSSLLWHSPSARQPSVCPSWLAQAADPAPLHQWMITCTSPRRIILKWLHERGPHNPDHPRLPKNWGQLWNHGLINWASTWPDPSWLSDRLDLLHPGPDRPKDTLGEEGSFSIPTHYGLYFPFVSFILGEEVLGGGCSRLWLFVSLFTRHEENYDIINVIISKLAYKIYLFLVESWQSERPNN